MFFVMGRFSGRVRLEGIEYRVITSIDVPIKRFCDGLDIFRRLSKA